MGLFSWITMDTNRSIPCTYSSRKPFPVTMTDDKGNQWHEPEYGGYGEFGGKDFYDLVAEMNGYTEENMPETVDELRSIGIALGSHYDGGDWGQRMYGLNFDHIPMDEVKFPNLTEDDNWKWRYDKPEDCENQGYFYPDEDDDDEYC